VCNVNARDRAVEPWLSNPLVESIAYGKRGKNCAQCNSSTKSLIVVTMILLSIMLVFIVKFHSEAGRAGLRHRGKHIKQVKSSRATTMLLAFLQVTFFMGDFQFR